MEWQKPELEDVNMSSEIGAYQDEFEGERDPRFVDDETPRED
jgi:hypothetical protein